MGIVAYSHGADLSNKFDNNLLNLAKLCRDTTEKIMEKVDEHVKSELQEQFRNENP